MPNIVSFSQLDTLIGKSLEPSDWLVIEQSRINQFADATDDHQFIHIDKSAAEKTELGGTIAHGLLTLSLLPKLVEQCMLVPEGTLMGINYGFDKVRFLNPVRPGDAIRLQAGVADVHITQAPNREHTEGKVLIKLTITIEIRDPDGKLREKKPALVCEWLNLFLVDGAQLTGDSSLHAAQ